MKKELSRQEKMQIAAKKHSNNTSGYRGVSWHETGQKWQCHIGINGDRVYLGLFDDEIDAAHAYDEAAKEHFGEYAALNFPPSNNASSGRGLLSRCQNGHIMLSDLERCPSCDSPRR